MAKYIIGDVHGCYTQVMQLLELIDYNKSKDELYFVGDLINRGQDSLKMLDWFYHNSDNVNCILGNHDFYLLAKHHGIVSHEDNLDELLHAKKITKYIDYLRELPVIINHKQFVLSHAGIHPSLNEDNIIQLNKHTQEQLQSKHYPKYLEKLFKTKTTNFNKKDSIDLQAMFFVNSCTRMRFIDKTNYELDYKHKSFDDLSNNLTPWFAIKSKIDKPIIYGHWASLGLHEYKNTICLDSGCAWGKKLTAYDIYSNDLIQIAYK